MCKINICICEQNGIKEKLKTGLPWSKSISSKTWWNSPSRALPIPGKKNITQHTKITISNAFPLTNITCQCALKQDRVNLFTSLQEEKLSGLGGALLNTVAWVGVWNTPFADCDQATGEREGRTGVASGSTALLLTPVNLQGELRPCIRLGRLLRTKRRTGRSERTLVCSWEDASVRCSTVYKCHGN